MQPATVSGEQLNVTLMFTMHLMKNYSVSNLQHCVICLASELGASLLSGKRRRIGLQGQFWVFESKIPVANPRLF